MRPDPGRLLKPCIERAVLLPCLGSAMDAERRIDAVRVLRMLRAESLLSAFGCYALNRGCEAGSYVIVDDHVNCTGENPLRGPNDERLGPRYPDMSVPYDARWSNDLKRGAVSLGLELRGVVFGRVAWSGPVKNSPRGPRRESTWSAKVWWMK